MAVYIHPFSDETDAQIASLISDKHALLVSCTKFQAPAMPVDVLDLNTFCIQSCRRLLHTSGYDIVVFKLDTVCPQLQYAYHLNSYQNVSIFIRNIGHAYRLHYEPEARYSVVYLDGQDEEHCSPQTYSKTKYGHAESCSNQNVSVTAKCTGVLDSFPKALSISRPEASGTRDVVLYDLLEGVRYDLFKGATSFSRSDGESPYSRDPSFSPAHVVDLVDVKREYLDYLKHRHISIGVAAFPLTLAFQLSLRILLEIKQSLEKINVFINQCRCHVDDNEEAATAEARLPLFGVKVCSGIAGTKRDRLCICHAEVIRCLFGEGILDEHLCVSEAVLYTLPVVRRLLRRAYGTTDPGIVGRLRSACLGSCGPQPASTLVESGGRVELRGSNSEAALLAKFKSRYMVDLDKFYEDQDEGQSPPARDSKPRSGMGMIEELYRKIPDNLQHPASELVLYTFDRGQTGILCAPSFDNYSSVDKFGRPVQIARRGAYKPTAGQLMHIKLYQILFFKMHSCLYLSAKKAVNYYYYAVPLTDDTAVDWKYMERLYTDFLLGSVADYPVLSENLIWNPFNRSFLIYVREFEGNIEDPVENTTFLEHFEQTYKVKLLRREGRLVFKGLALERTVSLCRKLAVAHGDDPVEFRRRAEACLEGFLPDGAGQGYKPSKDKFILSSKEACFVTSVKKTIITEAIMFESRFFLFEDVCAAHELRSSLGLSLPLGLFVQALTHSKTNPHCNYECLEFLGDCVLKYIVTNVLCLKGLPLKMVVPVKSDLISNDTLCDRCIDANIARYVTTMHPCYKMFQPPTVTGLDQFKRYFSVRSTFASDNTGGYISTLPAAQSGRDRKVYADVMEALIGAVFLSGGLSAAISFIQRVSIIKPVGQINPADGHAGEFPAVFRPFFPDAAGICGGLAMPYLSVLHPQDVLKVERILNHSFSNRGFLERALVHPSFGNNIFGSDDFQTLELIGDAALDLFVVQRIFHRSQVKTPGDLHAAKQSYINNITLGTCIVCSELFKYIKIGECFDADYATLAVQDRRKMPKGFGDIFEAVAGAILCDLNWNFDRFSCAIGGRLWKLIEEFQDTSCIGK